MTNLGKIAVTLFAVSLLAIGQGCGGGDGTGTGGAGGSTTEGGGGSGGGTGGTTMMTGGGGTGGATMMTGGGGTGGTGGGQPTDQGAQATDFVCSGGVAQSASYKMVFTLGQSTQNQSRTNSSNYVMQGGLIGATGSLK